MKYEVGMLCKHFKGSNLMEKNIYKIIEIDVKGSDIDQETITYSGDGDLLLANNLVVYANIFQNNKLFAREYEDISSDLSEEKKLMYNQIMKVEPLTNEEIKLVNDPEFIEEKIKFIEEKYSKKLELKK